MSVVTIMLGLAALIPQQSASVESISNRPAAQELHSVRRIHVDSIQDYAPPGLESFDTSFKAELTERGFQIVDAASEADAVLTGEWSLQGVLDGEGLRDYLKVFYDLQLTSPSGVLLWKEKVRIVERSRVTKTPRYQAEQVARRLTRAWNRSARKAGKPPLPK